MRFHLHPCLWLSLTNMAANEDAGNWIWGILMACGIAGGSLYTVTDCLFALTIQANVVKVNGQILWSVQPSQLVLFSVSYFITMQDACRME